MIKTQVLLIPLVILAFNVMLLLGYLVLTKGGILKRHLDRVQIDENSEMRDDIGNEVKVKKGIFHAKLAGRFLSSKVFSAIPDEETALRVASAITDSKSPEKNYSPVQVAYDKKDSIWIVSFREDTDSTESGNVENLAIRKKDGKILGTLIGWQSPNAN